MQRAGRRVFLQPPIGDTLRNLVVILAVWAKDGTVVVDASVVWQANDREVGTGTTLAGSLLGKGDSVTVTVTPTDGESEGEPVTAGPVVVQNSPPSAPVARIDPGLYLPIMRFGAWGRGVI
jgi:hypothetical protein